MNPPRLATWLLQRCVPEPHRNALIGDLVEQYRRGRRAVWYWRQALFAIITVAVSDLRNHKMSAARGVIVGWAVYLLAPFVVMPAVHTVSFRVVELIFWVTRTTFQNNSAWSLLVVRTPYELPIYLCCAASGWLVARLHRPYGIASVGLFALTLTLFEYGHVFWMLSQHSHPPLSSIGMMVPMVTLVGRPLSVLLGGVAGTGDGHQVQGGLA
jgi:hypothetical protein